MAPEANNWKRVVAASVLVATLGGVALLLASIPQWPSAFLSLLLGGGLYFACDSVSRTLGRALGRLARASGVVTVFCALLLAFGDGSTVEGNLNIPETPGAEELFRTASLTVPFLLWSVYEVRRRPILAALLSSGAAVLCMVPVAMKCPPSEAGLVGGFGLLTLLMAMPSICFAALFPLFARVSAARQPVPSQNSSEGGGRSSDDDESPLRPST